MHRIKCSGGGPQADAMAEALGGRFLPGVRRWCRGILVEVDAIVVVEWISSPLPIIGVGKPPCRVG